MNTSAKLSANGQKGLANILILTGIVGITFFIGVFLWANFKNGHLQTSKQKLTSNSEEKLTSYPDTDEPPTLTLFWGKEKKVGIPTDIVLETGQFGTFEGGGPPTPFKLGLEPNSEMEINLQVGEYPLYAFSKGIISNIESSDQGEVTIKYGRKYALKHLHIKNLDKNLKKEDKIEAGTFLGYTHTASLGDGSLTFSFLEIELDKVISNRAARAINTYEFFDKESKDSLEKIRQAALRDPKQSWVASSGDKSKSWIPYVGIAETWADMHKIGFEGDLESFEEFAKNNNLEWVLQKSVQKTSQNSDEPPLKLKSIGINFEDFKFTKEKLQFNRLFMGYGFFIPASSASPDKKNPQPTFILPLGTPVRSLVDGIVAAIPTVWSGDYSIQVTKSGKLERWVFETEHVINPKVKVGDKVTAGQIIAEVGSFGGGDPPGYGAVEIGILHGGGEGPPEHVCPFLYLDDSIKMETFKKMNAFFKSWEEYVEDQTLYDESLEIPGCLILDPIEG